MRPGRLQDWLQFVVVIALLVLVASGRMDVIEAIRNCGPERPTGFNNRDEDGGLSTAAERPHMGLSRYP